MIIKGLADLIYLILNVLLVFKLPSLPNSVLTVANAGVNYINDGIQVIGVFTGSTALGVLAVLLTLLLAMHAAYLLFTFVRFILRKIPMLGIDM